VSGESTGELPAVTNDFDALYRERRLALVRLATVITGSNGAAEEIVQEAFIRLHDRWDHVTSPIGFLRTVVTNLARSELRRIDLHRRRGVATREIIDAPELDETWAAICRLSSRQRAVLALRYYADLPEAEIAEILGCRIGTVKSAHHRALAKLREELK
jgi:RNA polymerase sigma-70 factor (sigma-E family)